MLGVFGVCTSREPNYEPPYVDGRYIIGCRYVCFGETWYGVK